MFKKILKQKYWEDISNNLNTFDKTNKSYVVMIIKFLIYKFNFDEKSILKHTIWLENSKDIVQDAFKNDMVEKIRVSDIRDILPKKQYRSNNV